MALIKNGATAAGTVTISTVAYYNGSFVSIATKLGLQTLSSDGLLFSANDFDDWTKTTINSQSKYWWRIPVTGGGTATVKEIYLIPHRPPTGITAGNDYTALNRVNLVSHILYCRPHGDTADWQDIHGLLSGFPINRLEKSQVALTASNAGDTLSALTYSSYFHVALGSRGTPQLTPFPQCQKTGTAIGVPYLELSAHNCDLPERIKRLRRLFFYFDNLDDSDAVEVFCRWDQNIAWWKATQSTTAPFVYEAAPFDGQQGVYLHVGVSLHDASVEAACPVLRLVEAEVEDMGDFGATPQPPVASPEVM